MEFLIGPYSFQLPHRTPVKAEPFIPPVDNFGAGGTTWQFVLGKFTFFIHLEASGKPEDLHTFILCCTKESVVLEPIEINGIKGVRYGDYNSQRSWIDWWMKKGELMICINLQGWQLPSKEDEALHRQVMESLRYVAT